MKNLKYQILLIISIVFFSCASSSNEYLKKSLLIDDYELANYYVSNGADVDMIVGDNMTLLADALLQGKYPLIKFLLKNKASVNEKVKGIPAFFYLFKSSNVTDKKKYQIFRLLLNYGADVVIIDNDSNNCAHYSIKYNSILITSYLYRKNKKLFMKKNIFGISPKVLLSKKIKESTTFKKAFGKIRL